MQPRTWQQDKGIIHILEVGEAIVSLAYNERDGVLCVATTHGVYTVNPAGEVKKRITTYETS